MTARELGDVCLGTSLGLAVSGVARGLGSSELVPAGACVLLAVAAVLLHYREHVYDEDGRRYRRWLRAGAPAAPFPRSMRDPYWHERLLMRGKPPHTDGAYDEDD